MSKLSSAMPAPPLLAVLPGREVLGLKAAIVSAATVLLVPTPQGLTSEGQRVAAIFTGILVLWATEALPTGITALRSLVLQPFFGLSSLGAAFASFMGPAFFFVLVMFLIGHAWMKTGLAGGWRFG